MREGMIITCPDYDDVTKAFFDYSKEIKDLADKKNVDKKELNQKEITAENFQKTLSKLDYSFVFLNGHGSETQVAGDKEIILSEEINFDQFGSRICYCRSCDSAKVLGKKLVSNGGAFIGYNRPFKFYISEQNVNHPLNDPVTELFLKPSNIIPKALLKRKKVREANERGKIAVLKSIKKAMSKYPNNLQIAVDLWSNYNSQVVHGDSELSITSEF
jgi:hypothetical protein